MIHFKVLSLKKQELLDLVPLRGKNSSEPCPSRSVFDCFWKISKKHLCQIYMVHKESISTDHFKIEHRLTYIKVEKITNTKVE